jgi:gamma-glutamyltranspeptidase/glutathione hydrolase
VDTSAGVQLLSTLAVIEAARLDRKPPYWEDPEAFIDLSRAAGFAFALRGPKPSLAEALKAHGVTLDPARPLSGAEAEKVAAVILANPAATPQDRPSHSDSLVVIDKDGNVCAMTHTINCVIWGDTGIVVGGVPLPDAAGFQQAALAAIEPGERLPNPISPIIAFRDGKPVLAAGQIGSCLVPETLRLMLGLLGQDQDLAGLQARPPLLLTFPGMAAEGEELEGQLTIPEGRYDDAFLEGLKAAGATLHMMPAEQARGMRGTVVTARLNPATGEPETCEAQGTYVRAEALEA